MILRLGMPLHMAISQSWYSSWPSGELNPTNLVRLLTATARLAWFAGVGRKRYWYGQKVVQSHKTE